MAREVPTAGSLRFYEIREAARYEHAWLLRAEGKTYEEIGACLGVGRWRANDMVRKFGACVNGSMRRASLVLSFGKSDYVQCLEAAGWV